MESYKKYQAAKLEAKRATDWLGNKQKTDSQSGQKYLFANVKFAAQYCGQSYAGATNYHDSPEAFNAAMAEVIREDFEALSARALAKLIKKELTAMIACKDDLAAVQAEIEQAESAA